ncbi:hypothetical protein HID58_068581 [Brassica napus]|uniref:Protein kinase domain-containing protein n=1 Tax=Brassica napus TaxID=3708 RepID=A0ABQ7ZLV0_BRANA|nr:hypothetical protein HID58_068581 [Brassica napus]
MILLLVHRHHLLLLSELCFNPLSDHYSEYDVEDSIPLVQPSLCYTAPEFVRSKSPSAGASSDSFSFGCIAYHLVARKPLLDCNNNVKMDRNDFELTTLPALVPLLSTESFESFHIDVRLASLCFRIPTDSEHLVSHVLPLLLRAYNDNDVRIQEEVLKRSTSVAKQLDGQVVKIHNRDHSGGKDSEASKEEGTCDRWWFSGGYRKVDSGRYVLYSLVLL